MSQVIIPDSSNVITTHPINSSTANNRSHTDFNSGSATANRQFSRIFGFLVKLLRGKNGHFSLNFLYYEQNNTYYTWKKIPYLIRTI